jgi:hypothetical protein
MQDAYMDIGGRAKLDSREGGGRAKQDARAEAAVSRITQAVIENTEVKNSYSVSDGYTDISASYSE